MSLRKIVRPSIPFKSVGELTKDLFASYVMYSKGPQRFFFFFLYENGRVGGKKKTTTIFSVHDVIDSTDYSYS